MTSIKTHINWKVEKDIGFLLFNNPPGNEMTPEFYHQLESLTSYTIPQSKVKAVIISGTGRHFSSGADLGSLFDQITKDSCNEVSISEVSNTSALNSNLKSFNYFRKLNIPVIAAINGICIGAALELAMFCHFRICAEGAVLGLPESTYELIPGIGGIQNMVAMAGQAKAIELILKGNTFSTDQAFKWNIVDYVVPKKELMNTAIKLAELSSTDNRRYLKKDYLEQLKKKNIISD